MFDFEERVLMGWLANTAREPAHQDAYLKVQHFCSYGKVVYHFWPEYIHQRTWLQAKQKLMTFQSF